MRSRMNSSPFRLVALATLAVPIAWLGCSLLIGLGPGTDDICSWVGDPDNCYRRFHRDFVAAGVDCKPYGDPSPLNVDPTRPNGAPNGAFFKPNLLDVCFIAGGGQVVIDPPIDLT